MRVCVEEVVLISADLFAGSDSACHGFLRMSRFTVTFTPLFLSVSVSVCLCLSLSLSVSLCRVRVTYRITLSCLHIGLA